MQPNSLFPADMHLERFDGLTDTLQLWIDVALKKEQPADSPWPKIREHVDTFRTNVGSILSALSEVTTEQAVQTPENVLVTSSRRLKAVRFAHRELRKITEGFLMLSHGSQNITNIGPLCDPIAVFQVFLDDDLERVCRESLNDLLYALVEEVVAAQKSLLCAVVMTVAARMKNLRASQSTASDEHPNA